MNCLSPVCWQQVLHRIQRHQLSYNKHSCGDLSLGQLFDLPAKTYYISIMWIGNQKILPLAVPLALNGSCQDSELQGQHDPKRNHQSSEHPCSRVQPHPIHHLPPPGPGYCTAANTTWNQNIFSFFFRFASPTKEAGFCYVWGNGSDGKKRTFTKFFPQLRLQPLIAR